MSVRSKLVVENWLLNIGKHLVIEKCFFRRKSFPVIVRSDIFLLDLMKEKQRNQRKIKTTPELIA